MKKLLLLVLCNLGVLAIAWAQQVVEKTLPVAANQKIDVQLNFGDAIEIRRARWRRPGRRGAASAGRGEWQPSCTG